MNSFSANYLTPNQKIRLALSVFHLLTHSGVRRYQRVQLGRSHSSLGGLTPDEVGIIGEKKTNERPILDL